MIARTAGQLSGAENCLLWLVDGDMLHVRGAFGGKPETLEYERAHPHRRDESHALTGRVVQRREVVGIPDVLADEGYQWGVKGFRDSGRFSACRSWLTTSCWAYLASHGRRRRSLLMTKCDSFRRSRLRLPSRSRTRGCSKRSSGSDRSWHAFSHRQSPIWSRVSMAVVCWPAIGPT